MQQTTPESAFPGMVPVWYCGQRYPATAVARGAAYELFSSSSDPGFLPNPRPGAQYRYRRYVHTTQVLPVNVPPFQEAQDGPLTMPVSPGWTYDTILQLSQMPLDRCDPGVAALVTTIRRTAIISAGSRMMKVLTPRQAAGYLAGWPLAGFCHREYDLAHLRTPADLAPLSGSADPADQVVFTLKWPAVDPLDYAVPFSCGAEPVGPMEADITGLTDLPSSCRNGAQVLGTGFIPNGAHLVPEWITTDFADLPMSSGTNLTAYTADGTEVVLYSYQPDQHAWLRMCGPQWRHLIDRLPLSGGSSAQEFFPISMKPQRLIARYQGRSVEAIADPPGRFRIAARSRAARHPVEAPMRRVRYVQWREVLCTIIGAEGDWHRVRLCHPDAESIDRFGADSVERGVYEAWAPVAETSQWRDVDIVYTSHNSPFTPDSNTGSHAPVSTRAALKESSWSGAGSPSGSHRFVAA